METLAPKVKLLSWTDLPVQTIYAVWEASRNNRPAPDPHNMDLTPAVHEVFRKVIDSKIPVAENVSFTFLLENISIAFREQMVRHRIGVKVGDRLGLDIVPDLADSTWWAQSFRILNMGKFASEGRFEVPETVSQQKVTWDPAGSVRREDGPETDTAVSLYEEHMLRTEQLYSALVAAGVPMEDARMVIPLAATSRTTWTLNLAALQHIIGKRGCWILQAGFWGPIIKGMVDELAAKVDPYFRNLIAPPCISGNKFTGCHFKLDNERRIEGEDEIPPCPLYLHNHEEDARETVNGLRASGKDPAWYHERDEGHPTLWFHRELADTHPRMIRMMKEYEALWGRNVFTGDPLEARN